MAGGANNSTEHLHVRLVSRRLVKASDASTAPHVLAVSNLDLVPQTAPVSMLCVYPSPSTAAAGGFRAVVEAFDAGLPGLLNHFFLLAGRIASDPRSGLPEVRCANQGAELVVAEAGMALASLDYGTATASLERILLPHADDVALSVQLVSFACGGFTVAWRTSHVLVDGSALGMLVRAWSELARSGTLAPGTRPCLDRSLFRPRAPPSYSATLHESYVPLDDVAQRQPGGNTAAAGGGIVKRLYYTEAREVARLRDAASREGRHASRVEALSAYIWKALAEFAAGAGHGRCRMGWVVDGRRRLTAPAGLRDAARNYFGNLSTLVVRETSAQEILRMPLPEVAAMARATVTAPAYDEHFQELVVWVEEHKGRRYAAAASQGVGSPAVIVSALASSAALQLDTDFGFGHAALVLPIGAAARLSSGFVRILARPGGDGSWIVAASVWPRLAAALDSDENHLFQPLTAEHLGLVAPQDQRSRL